MPHEIERKFLVKELPLDLSKEIPITSERYVLELSSNFEDRVQQVGDHYFRETLRYSSELKRTKQKQEISKAEFDRLKTDVGPPILRESYLVSTNPAITLKVYKGRFKPLVRAEVTFHSEEEAQSFRALRWMGKEITTSPLGRDASLWQLTDVEFQKALDAMEGFLY